MKKIIPKISIPLALITSAFTALNASEFNPAFACPKDTVMYLEANHVSQVVDYMSSDDLMHRISDVMAMLEDTPDSGIQEMEAFNAFLRHPFGDDVDLSLENVGELFPGKALFGMAIGVEELPRLLEENHTPDVYVMLEHNGDTALLDTLLSKPTEVHDPNASESYAIRTDSFMDFKLYIEEKTNGEEVSVVGVAAVSDKWLLVGSQLDALKDLIQNGEADTSDGLFQNIHFSSFMSSQGNRDLIGYLNFDQAALLINRGLEMKHEENMKAQAEHPEEMANPMASMLNMLTLKDALNFEAWHGFSLGIDFESSGNVGSSDFFYDEGQGLASLLTLDYGPFDFPTFIPAHVVSLDASHFNYQSFFRNLEQLVFQIVPQAQFMYYGFLGQYSAQAGIDIRETLLSSLGNEIYGFNIAGDEVNGEEELNLVVSLKLADKAGFQLALDSIFAASGMAHMLSSKEVSGQQIYTVSGAATADGSTGFQVDYTYLNDYLVLSINAPMALSSLIAGYQNSAESFWTTAAAEKIKSHIEGNTVGFSYSNLEGAIASAVTQLDDQMAQMEENPSSSEAFVESLPEGADGMEPEGDAEAENQAESLRMLNVFKTVLQGLPVDYELFSFSRKDEEGVHVQTILEPSESE